MYKEIKEYKMNNKTWIVIIIIIVLVIGVFAISRVRTASKTGNLANTSQVSGDVAIVAVSGTEFSFQPSEIKIKKGQPVKIVFTNNGQYPHNWVVNEFNAQTPRADVGQTTEVTFTPDKTGTFQFYCSVPGHLDRGMKGSLIVE